MIMGLFDHTFSECVLDAQPPNLNTAFHEEPLSQSLEGKLLSYFMHVQVHFVSLPTVVGPVMIE